MFRRILGAAIAAGAAIGAAALVKLMIEDDSGDKEEGEESEVRFISIDNGEEEAEPEEKKEEETWPQEIREISELYPYLEKKFIAEQFGRNGVFMEQYPEDTLITITHKAKFADEETMRDFTRIGEDNGYASEVLSETEATITRKMFTEDGSILSDIYNVANQVACLKGEYQGYNITL